MSVGLLIVVMLAEAFLHYFPWKRLLRGRDLPRPAAYVLGVLGLMLPFTAWLSEHGQFEIMKILWQVILAGGLSVLAAYGLDRYIELELRSIEAAEREAQLREQHAKS